MATERALELSTLKFFDAAIASEVGWLNVTKQAPLIDFTKVRGGIPPKVPSVVIGRFTQPVMAVQFVAVKVVAPAEIAAVFVIVRAAPLW
ncbi:MAG: hypothetical protein OEW85_12280 [Acidimicrobiia bacterium]|nr:hypothetical protein [Acidimicrobiia bacterium]MDH5238384.1 hypothetical protein [Acidimicrobiia bacterium]